MRSYRRLCEWVNGNYTNEYNYSIKARLKVCSLGGFYLSLKIKE